jgi:hypothetical protein
MSTKENDIINENERERQEEIMESNLTLEEKADALESGLPLDEAEAMIEDLDETSVENAVLGEQEEEDVKQLASDGGAYPDENI